MPIIYFVKIPEDQVEKKALNDLLNGLEQLHLATTYDCSAVVVNDMSLDRLLAPMAVGTHRPKRAAARKTKRTATPPVKGNRECEQCGGPITGKRGRSRYCSDECAVKAVAERANGGQPA